MADREQSPTSKREMDKKPQPGPGPTRTSGSRGEERDHGVRDAGSVGRDVPDQSKERNTEIAVEAGRKSGEHRKDKH